MNKKVLCEKLIKIANEFDSNGQNEIADEITKVAESVAANTREAFFAKRIFDSLRRSRGQQNIVQMAYLSGDTNLYQKATQLQQQEMQMNASKQALMQEINAAMRAKKSGQPAVPAQPAVAASPAQPGVPPTPAQVAPAQPVPGSTPGAR